MRERFLSSIINKIILYVLPPTPFPHFANLVAVLFEAIEGGVFSRSVVSNSLQPHGLQHVRPPCPSPTPRVYSNACPLSQ